MTDEATPDWFVPPERIRFESPSIGGVAKADPEDFVVVEQPLYEPGGDGGHLFLRVEKRDVPHDRMVAAIAELLSCPANRVRFAGRKDRRAVTTQWVSIETTRTVSPGPIADGVAIKDVSRHTNGLKLGHLASNLFQLRVRGVAADAERSVRETIDQLGNRFANTFGSQRFGFEQRTLRDGLASLDAPPARQRGGKGLQTLQLASVQAALFNRVLAARIAAGLLSTVLTGDVVGFPGRGGLFLAEQTEVEQQRLERGETCLTGPLPGAKSKRPIAAAAEFERQVLTQCGVDHESLTPFRSLIRGTRRPLTVSPEWTAIEATCHRDRGDDLRLTFVLPPGSYATSLLAQLGITVWSG